MSALRGRDDGLNTARGVLVGIMVGLAFWLGVVGACWLILVAT